MTYNMNHQPFPLGLQYFCWQEWRYEHLTQRKSETQIYILYKALVDFTSTLYLDYDASIIEESISCNVRNDRWVNICFVFLYQIYSQSKANETQLDLGSLQHQECDLGVLICSCSPYWKLQSSTRGAIIINEVSALHTCAQGPGDRTGRSWKKKGGGQASARDFQSNLCTQSEHNGTSGTLLYYLTYLYVLSLECLL